MIEKSRLVELIGQGATIYRKYADVNVYELKLNKSIHSVDNAHLWKKQNNGTIKKCGYPFENLFETREEAEWNLKFGDITRTETLSLPRWEEFVDNDWVEFTDKCYHSWRIFYDGNYITVSNEFGHYDFDYNKDGYIKACELAKKLFLGEVEE